MTYAEWFETHAHKHEAVVKKLLSQGLDKAAIIDYFDFDNMLKAEPDFCPLYAENKKCHAMEKLNCYLCACPYFRFDDNGLFTQEHATLFSTCAINAKESTSVRFGDAVHLDCSKCTVAHRHGFVEKHFDTEWKKIMAACRPASREESD